MCRDCGCSLSEDALSASKTVKIMERILSANEKQAESNRKHFERYGVLAVNLMGSPGSGKTSLLEKTAELLSGELRIAVVEGDLETARDAERLRRKGIPAVQITTGRACHLDALMVHRGIHRLPLEETNILFIENVGNLVCPADYDLGAHLNVVLLSTTEGDDKPEKYPPVFRSAQVLLISKWDLLPHTDFDPEKAVRSALRINPSLKIIEISSRTGEGFARWIALLRERGSWIWKQHVGEFLR